LYVLIDVYVYVDLNSLKWIYICRCVYVDAYVCIYIFVSAELDRYHCEVNTTYVYMHMYIYIYIYIYIFFCICGYVDVIR
jgi:hypothetical protein